MEEGTTPGGKPLKKSGTVRFGGWSRAGGAAAATRAGRRREAATDTRTTGRSSRTCTAIASAETLGAVATPALRQTRLETV